MYLKNKLAKNPLVVKVFEPRQKKYFTYTLVYSKMFLTINGSFCQKYFSRPQFWHIFNGIEIFFVNLAF